MQYYLPGKFHEQRNLEGYCPWGCRESNSSMVLCVYTCTYLYTCNFMCVCVCVCVHVCVHAVLCLVAQSCLTLCDPMNYSAPGSPVHGDSPGKNTAVGCHALLQGIFPTHRLNPGLPHCRWRDPGHCGV